MEFAKHKCAGLYKRKYDYLYINKPFQTMLNETFNHAEVATFRATTSGAYNIPGAYGVIQIGNSFPTTGAIPIPTIRNGTIISQGINVRGTGTLFTKQVKPGDYIYNTAQKVVRMIDYIISDNLLILKQAFPSDISVGVSVLICEQQTFKKIVVRNAHATTNAVLQEAPMAPGQTPFFNGGAPISYDASGGGTLEFTVHK